MKEGSSFLLKSERSTARESSFDLFRVGSSISSYVGKQSRSQIGRACGAFRQTDRTRLIKVRAVRNPVCNTPKVSNVNAEGIERASQKVEKRSRTSRSWFEGVTVQRVCKVQTDRMRKCAWQITRRLARPSRMQHVERLCGRAHNGQVSEFTEMSRFREPQKVGECSVRLWKVTVKVSSGHWRGVLARVRRCRPIWRRPVNQRWGRKSLTEMNGEPWNTPPRQEEKLQIQDRE